MSNYKQIVTEHNLSFLEEIKKLIEAQPTFIRGFELIILDSKTSQGKRIRPDYDGKQVDFFEKVEQAIELDLEIQRGLHSIWKKQKVDDQNYQNTTDVTSKEKPRDVIEGNPKEKPIVIGNLEEQPEEKRKKEEKRMTANMMDLEIVKDWKIIPNNTTVLKCDFCIRECNICETRSNGFQEKIMCLACRYNFY